MLRHVCRLSALVRAAPSALTAASASSRPSLAAMPVVSGKLLQQLYSTGSDAQVQSLRNRLLYRAKQRGFLELDLLVGLYAEKEIPNMDLTGLKHLSEVLDQENPDLFAWLTGQQQSPEHLLKNPVYVALRDTVAEQLGQNSQAATHASAGKAWVRGWDDSWRQKPMPKPAAPNS